MPAKSIQKRAHAEVKIFPVPVTLIGYKESKPSVSALPFQQS
jgi:hypothetical protein